MQFENAIVLTGGIATGKSTVATILAEYGLHIIDADKIAHKILDAQANTVIDMFGEQCRLGSKVDREVLGRVVFSNKNSRRKLEALLHPLIRDEIENQAELQEEKKKPYIIDIPLFFESPNYDIDEVIVVYTPRELQLSRLMNRDSYSEDDALKRINSQIDIDIKRAKATYVIDNSSDMYALKMECDRIYCLIMEKFKQRRSYESD